MGSAQQPGAPVQTQARRSDATDRCRASLAASHRTHLDQALAASWREQLRKHGCGVGHLCDEAPIQLHHHPVQAGQPRPLPPLRAGAALLPCALGLGGRLRWREQGEHALAQPLVHGAQLRGGQQALVHRQRFEHQARRGQQPLQPLALALQELLLQ